MWQFTKILFFTIHEKLSFGGGDIKLGAGGRSHTRFYFARVRNGELLFRSEIYHSQEAQPHLVASKKRTPSSAYLLLDHSIEPNLFHCKHDKIIHLLNDLQRMKLTLLILLQLKAKKNSTRQTIVDKFYYLESVLKAVLGKIYFTR